MAGTEEVKFVFSMDDQFSTQAKQAEKNVSGLEGLLTKVGGTIAAAFSVGAVINFGKSVVESYGKMEMFKTALTTMLHGNANEAEALNNQLINLAKTTPFELTEVQDATRQLIAFGSEAGSIEKELKTLGNVAAGIGAPIKDIAYLYGTIRTQGRAMTIDINQFANRGIPIWSELAKITGKNGLELRKFVEQGKVGFPQIQQVMANLTKEGGQFFNLMENQSKTVAGQISNLGDAWEQLKVSIGESQSGIIKSTLSWATRMVNDITEVWQSENRLEKAFSKNGAQQYGYLEKKGYFGFGSQHGRDEMQAFSNMRDLWHDNVDKATGNEAKLHQLYSQAAQGISNAVSGRGKTKDGQIQYERTVAVLKDVQDEIKGSLDLLKSKRLGEKKDTEAIKTPKESAKVRTPHYNQININIAEMNGIKEYEAKTANPSEAINLTAEQIVRVMVTAVENAQLVAGI